MQVVLLGFLVAMSASAVTSLVGARPSDPLPVAEKYFGCLPNYTFQVSGTNARCYKPATESTANIICGIGAVKVQDQFNGGKDGCQMKTNNVLTNYTCPAGFSPKVQPGPDLCAKAGTESILAPSVVKNL